MRRLEVRMSNTYYYDPETISALHKQLQPDPDLYGEEPIYAVWLYLNGSPYCADLFEDRGDFDQWPESDEEHNEDD